MGKALVVGALIVGMFSWSSLEGSWPVIKTVSVVYTKVVNETALLLLE